jgi:hypothetical protein
MLEAVGHRMSQAGWSEYLVGMKLPTFAGLALLGAALATAAHGQLMRVTFDTTRIVGDFIELNDRDENGYVIHNPQPIAGRLYFETYIDLAAAASPGEPQLFNSKLWGDIDVLGHLDDFGPTGLAVRQLSNGSWFAETPVVDYGGPLVSYHASLMLNPDLSPEGAYIEFRTYGYPDWSLFTGGPGLYGDDTTLWVTASADEMTATLVQGPPLTAIPEPATTGSIAALSLCGLIGWRRWLRRRADLGRRFAYGL